MRKVGIDIRLCEVASLLIQSEGVTRRCQSGIWNTIESFDARRCDIRAAILECRWKGCFCSSRDQAGFIYAHVNGCLHIVWGSSLGLDSALYHWSKLDTGSDIVNVRLEMLWHMISVHVLAGCH